MRNPIAHPFTLPPPPPPLQYGDSPLHYACFCGHLEAVRVLVNAGADAEKPSKDGKTPLQSAREENFHAVVEFLAARGAGGGDAEAGGAP